ncbi:endonuclease/exonuclease/phosphatase family protein [Williamwhitmania taraxaci]|uniref:Endonuclease/Exonuclease/phosphatase family protein n=1 Tax=Williamwhitmania taraxaci TaxID=1640674 RepID=A0A1G6PSP8_9BACT|nr:endonuclease/exonuclease/phosphatase family protein [Williamwhitmania taraxaci]SDC82684.1 Endonuclease/Exonuclease/phosphatase family protein [Williamwhitmania taraxaci]
MVRYLRYSLLILVMIGLIIVGFFAITEYRPKPIEIVQVNVLSDTIKTDTLTIITWNIGYAGLGKNMDFFFDGGKMVRGTKEDAISNLSTIETFLQKFHGDFIFIQEIDKNSTRSYGVDQVASLEASMPNFNTAFCLNYNSIYVPVPITENYGKVISGLMTLSKATPKNASRIALGSRYPWPRRLFMPKRAMLETRFLLSNGKELVLLNTHCEAYDSGSLRRVEMQHIKEIATTEYKKGNTVIIGGDWNQNPPGISTSSTKYFNPIQIPQNYAPTNWTWAFQTQPTNRYLYEPYCEGNTSTTIIDYFLLSPNAKPLSVNRIDLGFKNSDHNPIVMKFMLYNNAD